ncbi:MULTISPECIES: Z1 domain-containing protein [Sphingomonadales]|uniref:Z1 domain-containing protein n=1 Tax=Sphingomonadales TaxID=204457 RepID=UPI0032668DF5
MTLNPFQEQKDFAASLISSLAVRGGTPTKEEIKEFAESLANLSGYKGDLNPIVNEAMIAIDTRMGAGTSLVDVEAQHDDEWVFKRDDIEEWTYADAYEKYLKSEGWHPNVVNSLSDVAAKILGHLQDPKSEGSWDRRGLVIGHVQSGKTANYMGVIARAADAGYKFIIVIAGIHNNLRKQTQERIDEGFIGLSSDPDNRIKVGVGLTGDYSRPVTLTTINDDFNKNTANQSGWQINDFTKPIVIVIKKNVHTLAALHKWLKEMNAQGDGKISDVPVLMIDDEADNASINTNKPEIDPTRTNSMIRGILGLFAKSCYVGYTATPFANIFINPEAYDEEVYDELFPRDFIYSLDAPNTYVGPDVVFLEEARSTEIVEPIVDCEDYLPFSHKKDHDVFELPPSLYRAINQFIVARAIRNLRGQSNKHCSMMVNVSRFVDVQKLVRDFISIYEKKLREAVKANYAMPEKISEKNTYMQALKLSFADDFGDCGFEWQEVKSALFSVFDNLRLFVVNSKSDEALDYKKYEKSGDGLTAIAVGGLSLSRGLTIEGLCVSYMYRNTRMYDTLMQMGRWFGYRPGYEDVCKVHLSPDSIDWYAHIAEASEELRQQIKRMRRDGLSPKQFGLYVKAHPDSLLITAANKMRSGEMITMKQNFSLKQLESYRLPSDCEVNIQNEKLIAQYWENGFGGKVIQNSGKGWFVEDVLFETIEEFLTKFQAHPGYAVQKSAALDYLHEISGDHPIGDVLLISISENGEDAEKFRLGFQERKSRRQDNGWLTAGYRVASRGDEKLGLKDPQRDNAIAIAADQGAKAPSDTHYREIRNKPLLMLHLMKLIGKDETQERVPAFGISFPGGDYDKSVNVVANSVWLEQMLGSEVDNPDEEDDFDQY